LSILQNKDKHGLKEKKTVYIPSNPEEVPDHKVQPNWITDVGMRNIDYITVSSKGEITFQDLPAQRFVTKVCV